MVFQKISFNIQKIDTRPYKLILAYIPTINEVLQRELVGAYVIYFNPFTVSIRVITHVTQPDTKVSKLYYIHKKENDVLYGSGYSIHYNTSIFVKEEFKFEWNKNPGLFAHKKDKTEFFPSNNKELTITLIKNYRRLWENVK